MKVLSFFKDKDKPAPSTTSSRERDNVKANGKSSSLGSGGSQGAPTTEAAQGQQLQRRDNGAAGTSSREVGLVEATRQSGGSRGGPEAEVPWGSLFLSSCAVHLLGFAPVAKCVVLTLLTLIPFCLLTLTPGVCGTGGARKPRMGRFVEVRECRRCGC